MGVGTFVRRLEHATATMQRYRDHLAGHSPPVPPSVGRFYRYEVRQDDGRVFAGRLRRISGADGPRDQQQLMFQTPGGDVQLSRGEIVTMLPLHPRAGRAHSRVRRGGLGYARK